MKYSQNIVFNSWDDIAENIFKCFKLCGGIKGVKIIKEEGNIKISFLGRKLPKEIKNLITLKAGEDISDYEGLDENNEVCRNFPIESCEDLLSYVFGFKGRLIEIPSKNQDSTSSEIAYDIIYLGEAESNNNLNEELSELIEAFINFVDFQTDEKQQIVSRTLDLLLSMSNNLGNTNLSEEIKNLKLSL